MVKSIYLQDGEEIFVDDEDYERVNQYTWSKYYKNNRRYIQNVKTKKTLTSLIKKNHTQIFKNNDFTKNNLTKSRKNVPKNDYKKLKIDKNNDEWYAEIRVNLGCYEEEEAISIYDDKVSDYLDNNNYIYRYNNKGEETLVNYKTSKVSQHARNKNGYKGLAYTKSGNFAAYIKYDGKTFYIGTFTRKDRAALAYNKCSIYLHGQKAVLNNVPMNNDLQNFIDDWFLPVKIMALKEGANSE